MRFKGPIHIFNQLSHTTHNSLRVFKARIELSRCVFVDFDMRLMLVWSGVYPAHNPPVSSAFHTCEKSLISLK